MISGQNRVNLANIKLEQDGTTPLINKSWKNILMLF